MARGVIYEKSSSLLVKTYPTMKGAQIALTRAANQGKKIRGFDTAGLHVCDEETFWRTIDKKVVKRNLMSGKPFVDSINTPLCCDPSSETYWSM